MKYSAISGTKYSAINGISYRVQTTDFAGGGTCGDAVGERCNHFVGTTSANAKPSLRSDRKGMRCVPPKSVGRWAQTLGENSGNGNKLPK
jgi:hypothetical protein